MSRPEDFDAEEPEAAEIDALRGRRQVGELEGPAALVELLSSTHPSVLCGAANALYNLALDKPAAFRTAYRLAAPGAHFCLTDVVVTEGADQQGGDCAQSSCAAATQETSATINTQPKDAVPSSD